MTERLVKKENSHTKCAHRTHFLVSVLFHSQASLFFPLQFTVISVVANFFFHPHFPFHWLVLAETRATDVQLFKFICNFNESKIYESNECRFLQDVTGWV